MNEDKLEVFLCYFFAAFTFMFVWLKLTNVITWSWFWVLAPAWGPTLLVGLVIGIIFYLNWRVKSEKK